MKNLILFFLILISSFSFAQQVINEKLLFKTSEKIGFVENSKVYSIKDQGFLVYNKFSSKETLIMYDFDFNIKWKHSNEEVLMPFKYPDESSIYFVGNADNVYCIRTSRINNQILISQIDKNGKILKKQSGLGEDKSISASPIGAYILGGKLIILTLYKERAYEITMHSVRSDLSVVSKKISFPNNAFETEENRWGEETIHGLRCMWNPRAVIDNQIVFIKTYVKGKSKEDQSIILKTIEMDAEGVLKNEYSYNFKNTSGQPLKETFIQTALDPEKKELYIVGLIGVVNAANTTTLGFYVGGFNYRGESIYNFSGTKNLESQYKSSFTSEVYFPEHLYLDKFNNNLVLITAQPITFNRKGEIVKVDKIETRNYVQPTLGTKFYTFETLPLKTLFGVKKSSNIYSSPSEEVKPNSLDFTCKLSSDDHKDIMYYEHWNNYSDMDKNKEFVYLFMFHAGKGEMKAYKLKR
jgi:hypothetical protein